MNHVAWQRIAITMAFDKNRSADQPTPDQIGKFHLLGTSIIPIDQLEWNQCPNSHNKLYINVIIIKQIGRSIVKTA